MTATIQSADSRLATLLFTSRKPRVSYGSTFAPEFDWPPDSLQTSLVVVYGNAASFRGSAAEYFNAPQGYTVFVHDLRADRLRLAQAIPVRIDFWEGVYTAHNSDIEVFGTGETEPEALDDFRFAVADLYRFFESEGEENLGPLPLRQWRYLSAIVKKE